MRLAISLPVFLIAFDATEMRHIKQAKSIELKEFRSCQISVKMLPITADIIASSYNLYIFNLLVSNGVFVDDWKNAKVMERYSPCSRRFPVLCGSRPGNA